VGFTAHPTLQLYAQPLVASSAFDRYAAVVVPWWPGAGLRALAGDPPVNVLLLKSGYWWQS